MQQVLSVSKIKTESVYFSESIHHRNLSIIAILMWYMLSLCVCLCVCHTPVLCQNC